MPEYVIDASGLGKDFAGRPAVRDVSLRVAPGTIHGLLGPNGAGKTTSLRMMLGILDPDRGTRRLLGSDDPQGQAHRVGYLPEERGLYPAMRARDAIAFMGALRGLPWGEGRRRAGVMLDRLDLAHAADDKVRKLSKGMAQMVQLVGAIVHRPELVILDEPFSGLDPVNQERLEALVRAEAARGATVLFSTHVMAHAERLCDQLTIIARGRDRFDGTVGQARALLPLELRYTPAPGASDDAVAALLPTGAVRQGRAWRASIGADADGADAPGQAQGALIARLMGSGLGVTDLSIARPPLHDVFVDLVRRVDAEEQPVRRDIKGSDA